MYNYNDDVPKINVGSNIFDLCRLTLVQIMRIKFFEINMGYKNCIEQYRYYSFSK